MPGASEASAPPQAGRRVAVVIPIHNGIEHTVPCLRSLAEQTHRNLEVIVVDDGSTDGSSETIAREFPEVRLLHGDGELWWSGAVNLGVREALDRGADYVMTTNHDVVADPGLVAGLVAAVRGRERVLVGAKIYDVRDREHVWFFGSSLDPRTGDIVQAQGRDEDFREERRVQALTGMGLLIPARAFAEVGLFDRDTFPQYMADSDFTLRAARQGYELVVTPEAKLYADTRSSWMERELVKRELSLVPRLLFLERSPYDVRVRTRFYRRHHPADFRRKLLTFYVSVARIVLLPHAVLSLARLPRRLASRARGVRAAR